MKEKNHWAQIRIHGDLWGYFSFSWEMAIFSSRSEVCGKKRLVWCQSGIEFTLAMLTFEKGLLNMWSSLPIDFFFRFRLTMIPDFFLNSLKRVLFFSLSTGFKIGVGFLMISLFSLLILFIYFCCSHFDSQRESQKMKKCWNIKAMGAFTIYVDQFSEFSDPSLPIGRPFIYWGLFSKVDIWLTPPSLSRVYVDYE